MPEQPGEEKKTFKILPEGTKTFRIISESNTNEEQGKKKFIIHSETQPATPHAWFRQENSNDCGPCLLLNSLPLLGVRNIPSSITEVRTAINGMRRDRHEPELPVNSWLTSEDVGRYLAQVGGMEIEEYPIFPNESQEILSTVNQSLAQRPSGLIYTTLDRHFRGFIPTDDGSYLMLDSFLDAPRQVRQEEFRQYMDRSVAASGAGNRVERIGIARRSENPQYVVKT